MGIVGGVTGCGAPDLRAMSPTVLKSTAEVLLVDHPSHWYVQDAQSAAAQEGVVVKAVSVGSSVLADALSQVARSGHQVGMVMVVQDGQIPASEVTFAKQHTATQFTLFGASLAQTGVHPDNVHQVVPDTASVSYAIGTLAGDLAAGNQLPAVGWVTGGHPLATKANVQVALAAANAADPGIQMTNVPIAALSAVAVGTGLGNATGGLSTSSANQSAAAQSSGTQNGLTSAPGISTAALPRVLVTTQPLSAIQWARLKSAGVHVVSLCTQPAGIGVAGVPAVPGIRAMQQVMNDFAGRVALASTLRSLSAPLIAMDGAQVTAPEQSAVNTVELSLQAQSIGLQQVWRDVPTAARSTWSTIASQAGA